MNNRAMDDNFLINIEIAGKHYPLDIKRDEEEKIRAAAVQINSMLFQYRQHFGGSDSVDTKDLLAMVALHLSYRNLRIEEANDAAPFIEKISQVSEMLSQYVKEQ